MAGTGVLVDVGLQMSNGTSGAPSGPRTDRSSTVNAPPRWRSSLVGAGLAGFGCRRIGIISGVTDGGINSAMVPIASAHSGSNGTGGPTSVPEVSAEVDSSAMRTPRDQRCHADAISIRLSDLIN